MIRGMGQQFKFTLPYNSQYNFDRVSDVTVVFWQEGVPSSEVVKTLYDCTVSEYGTVLYATLNETDSLKFKTDRKAYVQMRAHTTDGVPFGTKAREFTVYPIHDAMTGESPDADDDWVGGSGVSYETLEQLINTVNNNTYNIRVIEDVVDAKANKNHGHKISDVTDLQSTLDEKVDRTEIPDIPVISVNDKTGVVELTAEDVGALPNTTKIPSKTTELTNDSGFITNIVSDLENYYKKSETLSTEEINQKISVIPKFAISVVTSLPTADINATTIYLVKSGTDSDMYTEYIHVNGEWEILGSQRVDLTEYAKETWVNERLSEFVTSSKINEVLGYVPVKSVNGKTGAVQLIASDVGAQPAGNYALKSDIPTALPASDVYDWAKQKTKPTYTASEIGLGSVVNERQYSENNPPPYPVRSVNGKTGVVQLGASDVGARSSTWMPTASEIGAQPAGNYALRSELPQVPTSLKNPQALVVDDISYDGSSTIDITETINSLIDAKLGVIENGSY